MSDCTADVLTTPSSPSTRRTTLSALAGALSMLLLGGCVPDAASAPDMMARFGKPVANTTVAVTTVTPSYGYRGTVVQVRITGSGFVDGSIASWERGGVADPLMGVLSTQFVSSTEVVATLQIDDDAILTLYDVVVTRPDKKKGVSTESFEVTTAENVGNLGGGSIVTFAASNNGSLAGYAAVPSGAVHAFFYSDAIGMVSLGVGQAHAMDDDGVIVAGFSGVDPVIFTTTGQPNQPGMPIVLPSARIEGTVEDIAGTGEAMVLGGRDSFKGKSHGGQILRPALWRKVNGAWSLMHLRVGADTTGNVAGVTALGEAVGWSGNAASYWNENGVGQSIGGSAAFGINSQGTVIAGYGSNGAAYWTRPDRSSAWSGPFFLPGGCQYAFRVDDRGNILARRCPIGIGSRFAPAVFTAASNYTKGVLLGGFGGVGETAGARAMSHDGSTIGGVAGSFAARWRDVVP